MNIDKNALNSILAMNDEEFARKIDLITQRLGMTQNSVSPERVRMMLRSMSERDLAELLSSMGESRAAEIMQIIKGGI